jgi:hypothetical protein
VVVVEEEVEEEEVEVVEVVLPLALLPPPPPLPTFLLPPVLFSLRNRLPSLWKSSFILSSLPPGFPFSTLTTNG